MQAGDGDWFILGVASDNVWGAFCRQVERDELAADPRFATNAQRIANYEALLPIVREIIRDKTCDAWLDELRSVGVPCGRINSVAEALGDPHVIERGFIVELEHPALASSSRWRRQFTWPIRRRFIVGIRRAWASTAMRWRPS